MLRGFLFVVLFIPSILFSQEIKNEIGYPYVLNFSPKEYNSLPQNFSIAEDPFGFIYFGNNNGVLQYDGLNFKLIKTKLESRVRSVAINNEGTIYVGGDGEIGKIVPDSLGNLSFKDLTYLLSDTINFGEIWNVLTYDKTIYFQSEYFLFEIKNEVVKTYTFEDPIRGAFLINGAVYIFIQNVGFKRLLDNNFVPIPFGDLLKNHVVSGMVSFNDKSILLSTADTGLFTMDLNIYKNELNLKKFTTESDSLFLKQEILSIGKLKNGQFSISTSGGGVVLINSKGETVNHLNEYSGLRDVFVNQTHESKNGDLWLALGNGISKASISSPISYLGKRASLEGIVEDVCRFNGELYTATHDGIYKLSASNSNSENGKYTEFTLVSSLQCWDLLPITIEGKKKLLGAFNDGIYEIKTNGEVQLIAANYPWKLHQSKGDSSLIFIGLDPGLGFIKYNNGAWLVGNENYDFEAIYNFSEVNNTLWAGTFGDGLVYGLQDIKVVGDSQLVFNKIEITDSTKKLPSSSVYTGDFNGQPLFAIDSAIFTYDKAFGGFKPFTQQTKALPGKRYFHRLKNQNNEKLWAVTVLPNEEFEFGYFDSKNNFEWVSNPFKTITDGIIHAIHNDSNGVTWLGGSEGLFRYSSSIKKDYQQTFKTHIRKVILNRTDLIFGGAFYNDLNKVVDNQSDKMIPVLNFEQNHLTFHFAAFAESDPEKHFYQYRLLGLEEDWSPPTNEPKAVYTNLEPGDYNFEVKSKNIYNVESPTANYKLSISPPWYKTSWYYACQFGFFGFLVFITLYLNRSKRDSEYTAVITFIALITVFEFIIFLIEPLVEPLFGGVPIFQLLMNIVLAISLNPVEYWVRGILKKK